MGESAIDVLVREHQGLETLFARVRDPDADRVKAWRETVKQITIHVAIERTYLFPLFKSGRLPAGRLQRDLLSDYRRMEHLLVLTERRKINSPDMPELITELLDVFEAHQDRCASLLIPAMQDQLPAGDLEELGEEMRAAESVILSHPHPHLLALGPVYQVTTRIASRWDRWRDRHPR